MRGARSTLVLLVVFLGLAAYVYFVERGRRPASEPPPNEPVFELEADAIDAITLSVDGNEIALSKAAEDGWTISAPIQARADTTTVSTMTNRLASLEIVRVISEEPTDLEPFGLAPPAIDVFVASDDAGLEDQLLIGVATPTGINRYAKLASEDRIIMVASDIERTFRQTPFDLRDKRILDVEALDVEHLEIAHGGSTIAFDKADGDWRMVEPWDVRADYSTVQGLVGRLGNGQMRTVVSEDPAADGADPAAALVEYGLVEPAATATVRVGSATASLRVGAADPDGARYARDAARPLVFTVDASLGDDLERGAETYRDRALFAFRPFNAQRISVARADGRVTFEKSPTEENGEDEASENRWRRIEPSPADVERGAVDAFLSAVSNLRAESFLAERGDAGLGEETRLAMVTVEYEDSGAEEGAPPVEEQVEIWRVGEGTYAVHGDEPGAAVVDSARVDDALDALDTASAQD